MNGNNHHFIRWEKVAQVSITDEMETHALAGVETSPEKAQVRCLRQSLGLQQVEVVFHSGIGRLTNRRRLPAGWPQMTYPPTPARSCFRKKLETS